MARVKSFRIHPVNGLPDREVTEFLTECEREGIVQVKTVLLPAVPEKGIDHRLTFIVTKLDDLPLASSVREEMKAYKE